MDDEYVCLLNIFKKAVDDLARGGKAELSISPRHIMMIVTLIDNYVINHLFRVNKVGTD